MNKIKKRLAHIATSEKDPLACAKSILGNKYYWACRYSLGRENNLGATKVYLSSDAIVGFADSVGLVLISVSKVKEDGTLSKTFDLSMSSNVDKSYTDEEIQLFQTEQECKEFLQRKFIEEIKELKIDLSILSENKDSSLSEDVILLSELQINDKFLNQDVYISGFRYSSKDGEICYNPNLAKVSINDKEKLCYRLSKTSAEDYLEIEINPTIKAFSTYYHAAVYYNNQIDKYIDATVDMIQRVGRY